MKITFQRTSLKCFQLKTRPNSLPYIAETSEFKKSQKFIHFLKMMTNLSFSLKKNEEITLLDMD